MKPNDSLTRANIGNLLSLWREAAAPFSGERKLGSCRFCLAEGSDWPNKCWSSRSWDGQTAEEAAGLIREQTVPVTLVRWTDGEREGPGPLEKAGFECSSVLTGMAMPLRDRFEHEGRLELRRVGDSAPVSIWESTYPQAFGYRISGEIPLRSSDQSGYFLVYYENRPAGTAIFHQTGKTAGIHGLGIVPSFRRRGFADEIMRMFMNRAIEAGSELAVLQAAEMGKGIYSRLGFEESFRLKSYKLPV